VVLNPRAKKGVLALDEGEPAVTLIASENCRHGVPLTEVTGLLGVPVPAKILADVNKTGLQALPITAVPRAYLLPLRDGLSKDSLQT
jgi:hypothetical protein